MHGPGDAPPVAVPRLTPALLSLLAGTCGLLVASLYFAQPLTASIAAELGLGAQQAGLIVTLTQLGYCAGLFLLTPLGDIVENRRLVLATMSGAGLALAGAASAPGRASFLVASLVLGASACAVQMLVPLAAHMAEPERRGRVIGRMTGGLLLGILLARPVASAMAALLGSWRTVFAVASALTFAMVGVIGWRLPPLAPSGQVSYRRLVGSLVTLFRTHRALRKRALSHAGLFGAFSLFWTAVPWLLLARGMTQTGLALFALAGAGGALVAPWAGHLADAGHARALSIAAMLCVALAFALTAAGGPTPVLLLAAVLLDAGVQANHVCGQREVLGIDPAARNRLNSVYLGLFFVGAAIASSVAGPLFHRGWIAVACVGAALPLVSLTVFLVLDRPARA